MSELSDLIRQDHRELEGLFLRYGSTMDPQIALRICDELSRHSRLEEDLVYPMLAEQLPSGESLIGHAAHEHHAAAAAADRLRSAVEGGAASEQITILVRTLKEAVALHVLEEESEVLPMADRSLHPSQAGELARRWQELHARAEQLAGSRNGR